MKLKFFKYQIENNIVIADFENPKSANAFSLDCAKELSSLIDFTKKKKLSGFILTSKSKTFCSGGNLSDYAKLKTKSQGIAINRKISSALSKLEKAPFPTVCCIQGDCFGGGVELISAFDYVVSTPQALFGFWQRRIGLSLGWGGGSRLLKRIGHKELLNLMQKANSFSAYYAKSIGLIDDIYSKELILEKSKNYILVQDNLSKLPLEKIRLNPLKTEQKLFESLWLNKDHQRLLSKFR